MEFFGVAHGGSAEDSMIDAGKRGKEREPQLA